MLNSHYCSEEQLESKQDIITIATHNHIADGINSKKMKALPAPSFFFEADISGEFPEKLYPLPRRIELKAGAQVMFIKNDSGEEKRYVNGKLALVDRIEDSQSMRETVRAAWSGVLKQRFEEGKITEAAQLFDAALSEIADLAAGRGMWVMAFGAIARPGESVRVLVATTAIDFST